MIFLYIVIGLVLLAIFYKAGANSGEKYAYREMEGTCGEMCEECQRGIFDAGWHAGIQYVLEVQQTERDMLVAQANEHFENAIKDELKKTARKVAKKKVTKKSKK